MNGIPKSSLIILALFLLVVGALWVSLGGTGPADRTFVAEKAGNEPDSRRGSENTGETVPDRDPGEPPDAAGGDSGGDSGGSSGQDSSAGSGGAGGDYEPGAVADPDGGAPDPLGLRAEAEQAARAGGQEAGVAGGERAAVAGYVLYAYGYSGGDATEYYGNLDPHIDPESFFGSPGGAEIQDHASSLGESPAQSAAELRGLHKIGEGDEGRERWLIRLEIGREFDGSTGEPTGDVTEYEQEVVLAPAGDSWLVYEAGRLRGSGRS